MAVVMLIEITVQVRATFQEVLILLHCSYVDRLTANLEKLMSDADKMSSMSRLMATRREDSVAEQQLLEPQLDLLRRRTKELQKQVGASIDNNQLTFIP